MPGQHVRLGEVLIEKGIITQEQVEEAFVESKDNGTLIGEEIIRLGFASEEDVYKTLSEQLDIAYIDISSYELDPECVKLIPWGDIKKYKAIPIYKIGNSLTVATCQPLNMEAIEVIETKTKMGVNAVFSTPSGIEKAIDQHFDQSKESLAADLGSTEKSGSSATSEMSDDGIPTTIDDSTEGPAIQLVHKILVNAVSKKASDIHFEPREKGFFCQYRIDGKLQDPMTLDKELQAAAISRIKIISDLDIAENRLPQDGRCRIHMENKDIDFRVATFPTIHGEHVAIRILDKSMGILPLEQLGMDDDLLKEIDAIIHRPHGIILVTGPTGTGKSTTLYSVLNTICDSEKNIITLEDPVEYSMDGISQAQVNVKAGLTFAIGLRSTMRLDPDIIMIGEIRDKETALTPILVFVSMTSIASIFNGWQVATVKEFPIL